jgi:endonuclease/exonuclease/phosphatase family metal-dependent hydrolase
MDKLKVKRLVRRSLLWIAVLFLIYLIALLLYGTFTDYEPEDRIELEAFQNSPSSIILDSILQFTIWNIGFGGLGRESDFFYDDGHFFFSGGKQTRTPEELVQKNVNGVLALVDSVASDFYLFQEVDRDSRRSYHIDQVAAIAEKMPDYAGVYAPNFVVACVPLPLLEPWHAYGKANSGLASYSRFQPSESVRWQLPGDFSWPKQLFSLDRCLNMQRFPLAGGQELVVFNVHNSAYDADGGLKLQQLEFFKKLALEEYEKGNYVIAGGDWNMCPPYFRFDGFMPGRTQGYHQFNIDDALFPQDWHWVYDAAYPTNRKTRTPFQAGETFVTTIDFFLISPNVRVRKARTINLDFAYSDHQPVWMEIELVSERVRR